MCLLGPATKTSGYKPSIEVTYTCEMSMRCPGITSCCASAKRSYSKSEILAKIGLTITMEVSTTLQANWSVITSYVSLVFAPAGGIQSLPRDEGDGGFLLSYVPLILSVYISSIIPDNVPMIRARYNLNPTTWDGTVPLTQEMAPKRGK